MARSSRGSAPRSARPDSHRRPPLGQHRLRPPWAQRLVADAGVGPGDLVLDIGAGTGALTAPLAATGATVVAVEIDRRLIDHLRHRFEDVPNVRVVAGDARRLRLPRRPFVVVANLPFGVGTAVVRHLLGPGSRLQRAHLVLDAHAAVKRADAHRLLTLQTGPWFTLRPGRRLPAHAFRPVPSVDARVLMVEAKVPPLLPPGEQAAYARWVAGRRRRGPGVDRGLDAWVRAWRR